MKFLILVILFVGVISIPECEFEFDINRTLSKYIYWGKNITSGDYNLKINLSTESECTLICLNHRKQLNQTIISNFTFVNQIIPFKTKIECMMFLIKSTLKKEPINISGKIELCKNFEHSFWIPFWAVMVTAGVVFGCVIVGWIWIFTKIRELLHISQHSFSEL